MKTLKEIILNEGNSSGKQLLVLIIRDEDGKENRYYFWTNLNEDDTEIINSKILGKGLEEILKTKYPKIYKEVQHSIEYSGYSSSKARVFTERISMNKIKNL